jgi:hypothetical protein
MKLMPCDNNVGSSVTPVGDINHITAQLHALCTSNLRGLAHAEQAEGKLQRHAHDRGDAHSSDDDMDIDEAEDAGMLSWHPTRAAPAQRHDTDPMRLRFTELFEQVSQRSVTCISEIKAIRSALLHNVLRCPPPPPRALACGHLCFHMIGAAMQVNGQRNCKQLLLADWNRDADPSDQISDNETKRMLHSMGLKPGVMTRNQVRPLLKAVLLATDLLRCTVLSSPCFVIWIGP